MEQKQIAENVNIISSNAVVFEHERVESCFKWGEVLIVGAGATAGTAAVIMDTEASQIDLLTTSSENSRQASEEFISNGGIINATGKISGNSKVDGVFLGDEAILTLKEQRDNKAPDTVVLCTPNQLYAERIKFLAANNMLKAGQTIIGISTRLGSGDEIVNALIQSDIDPNTINIASFSTYYAATKHKDESRTEVWTRAVKDEISVGIWGPNQEETREKVNVMLGKIGTKAQFIEGTLGAEIQNANIFVHAQLVMLPRILEDVMNPLSQRMFMYRPEEDGGALSIEGCLQMAKAEEDINMVLEALQFPSVNLANLLYNNLYPVLNPPTEKVDNYLNLHTNQKAQLLHSWFLKRQKDPFTGEPHLEAVKLQKYSERGIPRIPGEDYVGIALMCKLAESLGVEVVTLNEMKQNYDKVLLEFSVPNDADFIEIENLADSIIRNRMDANVTNFEI
jgi:hypothetical protein